MTALQSVAKQIDRFVLKADVAPEAFAELKHAAESLIASTSETTTRNSTAGYYEFSIAAARDALGPAEDALHAAKEVLASLSAPASVATAVAPHVSAAQKSLKNVGGVIDTIGADARAAAATAGNARGPVISGLYSASLIGNSVTFRDTGLNAGYIRSQFFSKLISSYHRRNTVKYDPAVLLKSVRDEIDAARSSIEVASDLVARERPKLSANGIRERYREQLAAIDALVAGEQELPGRASAGQLPAISG